MHNLREEVVTIIKNINDAGFEAYAVGGCVRDFIRGVEPEDYDVATNAKPEEIIKIFSEYRVIETGIKHGTVTVLINSLPVEITTYRIDGKYSDNRRPDDVQFTSSLKEDLTRRDFTMNAIAFHPSMGYVDYNNGREDIEDKIVRCVGDPKKRFEEDALRIMRALRFSSQLGFSIEEKTVKAIFAQKDLLKNISAERISSEMTKLLMSENVKDVLLKYIDVIGVVIPELLPMKDFDQKNRHHIYDVLEHTAIAVGSVKPTKVLRWAALLHDVGKPAVCTEDENGERHFNRHDAESAKIASSVMDSMRMDTISKDKVVQLVKRHDISIEPEEKYVKRWLNKLTPEVFFDLMELKRADNLAQSSEYRDRLKTISELEVIAKQVISKGECFTLHDLKITGDDLIALGYVPGKLIGKTLDHVLEKVIDGKLANDYSAIIETLIKEDGMPIKKGDTVTLTIEDMTSDGSGVGRVDRIPVFVPLTAVGDKVEVKILKLKKSHAFGKLENIVEPSPTRVEVDCPIFEKCGGCTYRHINYEEELRIKTKKVVDAFRSIAHSDVDVLPCISGNPNYYRNKAQIPVGDDKIGFYSRHSHRIVDIGECKIQNEIFNKAVEIIREWIDDYDISFYDEEKGRGYLRHIYMRIGEATGEIMLCLVVNSKKDRLRIDEAKSLIKTLKENEIEIISFLYNINRANTNIILGKENVFVHGKENISDKLFDLTFEISPQSFYQVNHDQTEKLYAKIIELAEFTGNETVLDLYCGIGTIALSIADKVKEVYGVELVKEAIVNAEKNAKLNNITNVKFNTGDADEAGDWLKSLEVVPDVIIVDPPRKGLSNSALLDIMAMDPAKIIYVSCDPATLARDAKILTQSGYTISTIQPLDLFPRTPHVETVILLANN